MNRIFRSAFLPLILIVVLVWLATQTLIPKSKNSVKKTTSEVIALVKPADPRFIESLLG